MATYVDFSRTDGATVKKLAEEVVAAKARVAAAKAAAEAAFAEKLESIRVGAVEVIALAEREPELADRLPVTTEGFSIGDARPRGVGDVSYVKLYVDRAGSLKACVRKYSDALDPEPREIGAAEAARLFLMHEHDISDPAHVLRRALSEFQDRRKILEWKAADPCMGQHALWQEIRETRREPEPEPGAAAAKTEKLGFYGATPPIQAPSAPAAPDARLEKALGEVAALETAAQVQKTRADALEKRQEEILGRMLDLEQAARDHAKEPRRQREPLDRRFVLACAAAAGLVLSIGLIAIRPAPTTVVVHGTPAPGR